MTPLPVWLHVLGGLALGLLGLRALALCARRRSAWLFLAAIVGLAAGIDALRLLVWRTAEAERPVPAALPVALALALALARVVRDWRALGATPESGPEKTSRRS